MATWICPNFSKTLSAFLVHRSLSGDSSEGILHGSIALQHHSPHKPPAELFGNSRPTLRAGKTRCQSEGVDKIITQGILDGSLVKSELKI